MVQVAVILIIDTGLRFKCLHNCDCDRNPAGDVQLRIEIESQLGRNFEIFPPGYVIVPIPIIHCAVIIVFVTSIL